MEIAKPLLIDAICGRGFPSLAHADRYTRAGLARFTRNQHNEAWSWDREALAFKSLEQLGNIYRELGGVLEGGCGE